MPMIDSAALEAGVDEAGRGPLAGPVVAAAVILCPDGIPGLADSKTLSFARREKLEAEIRARCLFGIGMASVEEIDSINILQATMLAMTRATDTLVRALGQEPGEVLVDGNRLPRWGYRARAIVKGDASFTPGLPESFNVLIRELQALCLDVELVKLRAPRLAPLGTDEPVPAEPVGQGV